MFQNISWDLRVRVAVCVWAATLNRVITTFQPRYILMRKAVACELDSVVEVDWVVDLNKALRMVWGSTSGVGWEEAGRPPGRDREAGRPSFLAPPLPGVSLNLLRERGERDREREGRERDRERERERERGGDRERDRERGRERGGGGGRGGGKIFKNR